jgi:hypothetical protein
MTSALPGPVSAAVAAALPKQPTVPVVWKEREAVVRGLHRRADARGDLVADGDRLQQLGAARAAILGHRERRRDRRAARVVDRVAEDVVELHRMRDAAVDPGRRRRESGGALPGQARLPVPQFSGMRLHQLDARRDGDAGEERGEPVDQCALRVVRHFRWQGAAGFGLRVLRKFFDDRHGGVLPPRAASMRRFSTRR